MDRHGTSRKPRAAPPEASVPYAVVEVRRRSDLFRVAASRRHADEFGWVSFGALGPGLYDVTVEAGEQRRQLEVEIRPGQLTRRPRSTAESP